MISSTIGANIKAFIIIFTFMMFDCVFKSLTIFCSLKLPRIKSLIITIKNNIGHNKRNKTILFLHVSKIFISRDFHLSQYS